MHDDSPFLRAIIAAPSDDLPRLVYADWLEDRGDPLSEFIRVQIALEEFRPFEQFSHTFTTTTIGEAGKVNALRRREREMLDAHKIEWTPPAVQEATIFGGASPEAAADGLVFRRGFVEAATCTLADWLAHGPAIVRACPVREVRLSDCYVTQHAFPNERGNYAWDMAAPVNVAFPTDLAQRFRKTEDWLSQESAERDIPAILIAWAKAEADRLTPGAVQSSPRTRRPLGDAVPL